MPRSSKVPPLVGFLICVAAVVSYPTFFAKFPATRDVPWVNWLLFALGLGLVARGILRGSRIAGSVFALASVGALVFFVFMTEVWSRQLPASSGAPHVGQKAPDFSLAAVGGSDVRLSNIGSWSLLIFYRGYW